MTTRHLVRATGMLMLTLTAFTAPPTLAGAASAPITVTPNPTAYYKPTTFTARVGRAAGTCHLFIDFQTAGMSDYAYDNFPSARANRRGVVSWTVRIGAPTPSMSGRPRPQPKGPWSVQVNCAGRAGLRARFRLDAKEVHRTLSRTQIVYAYWRTQLSANSYDCFNHLFSLFPSYVDQAQEIVSDCTTRFRAVPPPSDVILDRRIQQAYDDYNAVAQKTAGVASDAVSSGSYSQDDWLQAMRD